jgi:hypothetical protein
MSTSGASALNPVVRGARAEPRTERVVNAGMVVIAILVALRIFATIAALPTDEHVRTRVHAFSDDAKRYHEIADSSGVPYRDFAVEFPPAALGLIEAVDAPTVAQTMGRLAWASLVLDLAAAGAIAYAWGRRGMIAYLLLGLPFFYLPFVYFRIDLLSVALAAWGCALVKRRHDAGGGVLLAVAVFAKLWPLALLPLLIIERRWKALWCAIGVGIAGGVAWLAVAGTDGFEQVLTFRHAKGWQVESVAAGILRTFDSSARTHIESGASRFGTAPAWATTSLALVMLALVAGIWLGVARRPRDASVSYAVAPIAAIGTFMVCSPLLSPQYLIWLLPFAAVAWVTGRRLLAAWVAATTVTTMVLTQFLAGLNRGETSALFVLNVRNAMLVALVVYATVLIWGRDRRPTAQVMSSMRWSATRAHSDV